MAYDPILYHYQQREEAELSKIATGIGKVFLQQVKEREKIRAYKATHLDPRNASRTPAADREPGYKLRFGSSLNACKIICCFLYSYVNPSYCTLELWVGNLPRVMNLYGGSLPLQ